MRAIAAAIERLARDGWEAEAEPRFGLRSFAAESLCVAKIPLVRIHTTRLLSCAHARSQRPMVLRRVSNRSGDMSTLRIHQPVQRCERHRAHICCQLHCTRRIISFGARGCNPRQQRCCLVSLQRPSTHRRKAAPRPHQCLVDVSDAWQISGEDDLSALCANHPIRHSQEAV